MLEKADPMQMVGKWGEKGNPHFVQKQKTLGSKVPGVFDQNLHGVGPT